MDARSKTYVVNANLSIGGWRIVSWAVKGQKRSHLHGDRDRVGMPPPLAEWLNVDQSRYMETGALPVICNATGEGVAVAREFGGAWMDSLPLDEHLLRKTRRKLRVTLTVRIMDHEWAQPQIPAAHRRALDELDAYGSMWCGVGFGNEEDEDWVDRGDQWFYFDVTRTSDGRWAYHAVCNTESGASIETVLEEVSDEPPTDLPISFADRLGDACLTEDEWSGAKKANEKWNKRIRGEEEDTRGR